MRTGDLIPQAVFDVLDTLTKAANSKRYMVSYHEGVLKDARKEADEAEQRLKAFQDFLNSPLQRGAS